MPHYKIEVVVETDEDEDYISENVEALLGFYDVFDSIHGLDVYEVTWLPPIH